MPDDDTGGFGRRRPLAVRAEPHRACGGPEHGAARPDARTAFQEPPDRLPGFGSGGTGAARHRPSGARGPSSPPSAGRSPGG